jgi:hypothetical protein
MLKRLSQAWKQFAGHFEHAIDAQGADCHDVSIEHHVGQPPVSLRGVESVEGNDRGLLLVLQPEITRDRGIVLVWTAHPMAPTIEFAPCDL